MLQKRMPGASSSCSSRLRAMLQTSLFMGAWEVGAASSRAQGRPAPAAGWERRAPAALNAACVPASTATDNEPFQGAGASPAVAALPASTGSGGKQPAGSMLGGPRSRGLLLQTKGHLPPWPCCSGVAAPSVSGHEGCSVSVGFPRKLGWGGGWRVRALAEMLIGSPGLWGQGGHVRAGGGHQAAKEPAAPCNGAKAC